jgi:hypothetical protein
MAPFWQTLAPFWHILAHVGAFLAHVGAVSAHVDNAKTPKIPFFTSKSKLSKSRPARPHPGGE